MCLLKDWLTNKVDRCVGGRVATQQCAGSLQLPLNNCGVMALDYESGQGVATSMGHAPVVSLIDSAEGAKLAIVEALNNLVWAPLKDGLSSVSLSANWMWPCKNAGEDSRLYNAVEAVSKYCIGLGINVPTGKDSLSMKQKYPDGDVISPGTVVISATGHCKDINRVVSPNIRIEGGHLLYIPLAYNFSLGGSAFAQIINKIGNDTPATYSAEAVRTIFDTVQDGIMKDLVMEHHLIKIVSLEIIIFNMG